MRGAAAGTWTIGAATAGAALLGAVATQSLAGGPAATAERAAAPAPVQPGLRIDAAKELMITHLSVVEDQVRTRFASPAPRPTGLLARPGIPAPIRPNPSQAKWTFGKLISDMAGPNDPSAFVLDWLAHWETDQQINGFTAAARPDIRSQVIDPWLAASGGARLDMSKAPFRLLAIVNRLDLRKNPSYAAGDAGEGRFVFGVTDPRGDALAFTVILEYELPARTLADVKAWATRWHELAALPFGAAYNAKLEAITDRFAARNAMPAKTNGSAINQVRTNEITLRRPWELREFRLASRGGKLVQTTCTQEVDMSLFNTQELGDYIIADEANILAQRHTVPVSMRAAAAPEFLVLNAPGRINPEARHRLSLNTCSGCHFRETGTSFTHVDVRQAGQEARLSGFLTGITAGDPITGAPHAFNDLAGRAQDLRHVLTTPAPVLMVEPAVMRTH